MQGDTRGGTKQQEERRLSRTVSGEPCFSYQDREAAANNLHLGAAAGRVSRTRFEAAPVGRRPPGGSYVGAGARPFSHSALRR